MDEEKIVISKCAAKHDVAMYVIQSNVEERDREKAKTATINKLINSCRLLSFMLISS